METRALEEGSLFALRQKKGRYICPRPACPHCHRTFSQYHEVYLHAIAVHKVIIDTTYTCQFCHQVCQNPKGLHVHVSHAHKEEQEEGDAYKRRRRSAVVKEGVPTKLESIVKRSPSPIPKVEPYSSCPTVSLANQVATAHSPPTEVKTEDGGMTKPSVTVVCPICHATFARTDTHITLHDAEITSTYRSLPETTKMMIAGIVMEMSRMEGTRQS